MRRTCVTWFVIAAFLPAAMATVPAGAGGREPPQTGFEERNGDSWTTHEEEIEFLAAVDELSDRVDIEVIGETAGERPLHLVKIGHPEPHPLQEAPNRPSLLFVCSQHGNEPAGRETCLQLLRDLAFTKDRTLVAQMRTTTILFVPAANPDGSVANTRGNSAGTDINRDHLNLTTPEAQAFARVTKRWRPDVVLDLHEYGPSVPVLYDDDILYLWPRNLNVDAQVYGLAKTLAIDYIGKGAERAGYTADEYGIYAVGDQDVTQTAGDGDEGILRNAMGLRHAIGILVETAVTANPQTSPTEPVDEAEVNRRRVESQTVVTLETLRFMREQGDIAMIATARAFKRKAREGGQRSAPVYFGGADNDEPEPAQIQDPPPCGYRLDSIEGALRRTLALLSIRYQKSRSGLFVFMGQPAEPVIPLLLDERGIRHAVAGTPVEEC